MNNAFNWIKVIHVLGASALFGVNLTVTFYALLTAFEKDHQQITSFSKQVVIISLCFIGVALFIQPISGFAMAYLKGYVLTSLWGVGSFAGYGIVAVLWLPILFLQLKCRELAITATNTDQTLSKNYFQYLWTWIFLSLCALASMSAVFYLMANRPGA